jgi:hypothetical protein
VEGQLGLKRTLDAIGPTKSMPFAREGNEELSDPPTSERFRHDLGLAWRYHGVLQPMHQQHRTGDPIDGMHR